MISLASICSSSTIGESHASTPTDEETSSILDDRYNRRLVIVTSRIRFAWPQNPPGWEPATPQQLAYIRDLCERAYIPSRVRKGMSKAEASAVIEYLLEGEE